MDEEGATAVDLAGRCSLDADALNRMLRLLATHGVFQWDGARYQHSPASRLLRDDHPQSLRALARMIGAPWSWGCVTDLMHTARHGKPSSTWADMVGYMADHPVEAQLFNQAMTAKAGVVIPGIVAAYDFTCFATVADIGGGRGHLLGAILDQAPGAGGILVDLPHVIADVPVRDRVRAMACDFFVDPLPPADVYVLMEVLHDWADGEALAILKGVRRAAPPHARLLIIETVLPDTPQPHFGNTMDIVMLAITGGRERTRADYEELLADAGFRLDRVVQTDAGAASWKRPSHDAAVQGHDLGSQGTTATL